MALSPPYEIKGIQNNFVLRDLNLKKWRNTIIIGRVILLYNFIILGTFILG
jgi:hypothetical protein